MINNGVEYSDLSADNIFSILNVIHQFVLLLSIALVNFSIIPKFIVEFSGLVKI